MAEIQYLGSTSTTALSVRLINLDDSYSYTGRKIEWSYSEDADDWGTEYGTQSLGKKVSQSSNYTIKNLTPGGKYYVNATITGIVEEVDDNGNVVSKYSVDIEHPGYYCPVKPTAPTSLSVSTTTSSFEISWTQKNEYDGFGYEVVDSNGKQIDSGYITDTSITIEDLDSDTKYSFRIFAYTYHDENNPDNPGDSYIMSNLVSKSVTTDAITYDVEAKRTNYTSVITAVSPDGTVDEGDDVTFKATLIDYAIFQGWYKTSSTSTRYSYYNPYYYNNVYSDLTLYARAVACDINVYNVTATSAYVKIPTSYSYYTYRVYIYDDTAGTAVMDQSNYSYTAITSGIQITGLTAGHNYRANIGYCYTDQNNNNVTTWISSSGGKAFSYSASVTCTSQTSTSLTFKVTGGTVSNYILYHNGSVVKSANTSNTTITVSSLYPSSTYVMQVYFTDGTNVSANGTTDDPTLSETVSGNRITVKISGGSAYLDSSWSIYKGSTHLKEALSSSSTSSATFTGLDYSTNYIIYCTYRVADGSGSTASTTALRLDVTTGEKPAILLWEWTDDEEKAFNNHLPFKTLTADRWNDFIDWCDDVLTDAGKTTIGTSYHVVSNGILLASDFNLIVTRIENGTGEDTGIPTVHTGDVVKGSYFFTLANIMNDFLGG